MADAKVARRVFMSSSTDTICYASGGTAAGGGDGDTYSGSDGEGDLKLLQDKDGKSDGDGEDDDGKSVSGGEDDDGISDGSNGWASSHHQSPVDSGGAGLTGKVVISSLESDMMTNGTSTPARDVVAGKVLHMEPCENLSFLELSFRACLAGAFLELETTKDLQFVANLHNLWVELLEHTNERKLFINELEALRPRVMSYKCLEFLHKVQKNDVMKLLELGKMIAKTSSGEWGHVDHLVMPSLCRETGKIIEFASGISKLWDELFLCVNGRQLFIPELEGLRESVMALKCVKFLKHVQHNDVIKLLELRKMITEVHL
ncbi:hypothetical protein Tco_1336891 [Tanacetum coccineum]